MAKLILRLLAVFVFLFGCLLAPMPLLAEPTNSVVISELQTGGAGSGTASAEFIELYNNSSNDVNLGGWKVEYLTASGTTTKTLATLSDTLTAHGYALLVTAEFGSPGDYSFTAGLASTAGHIRLKNELGDVVDMVGWGSTAMQPETLPAVAPSGGHSIARSLKNDQEIDTNNNAADFYEQDTPTPQGGSVYTPAITDVCPNIAGDQTAIPDNYLQNADGDCIAKTDPPTEGCKNIELSELLANPAGDDGGHEYIEIYNNSSSDQSLSGCSVKVGSKTFNFPDEQLSAGAYRAFYSDQTGLQLTNTGGEVTFITPTTETVVNYPGLSDDQTWASINNVWQVSDTPTPSSQNIIVTDNSSVMLTSTESVALTPCPSGKYRNPATNRCKSFNSASSTLIPCKPGQERNPDTNRCRNVVLASSSLAPCKEGQERNPDTNRCRSVQAASAPVACKEGYERNPETNRCRKTAAAGVLSSTTDKPQSRTTNYRILVLISFLVAGYGIYEYRTDLRNLLVKVRLLKDNRTSSQQ